MSEEAEGAWWERTWTAREDAMWERFGPSHPHDGREGDVTSFNRDFVPLPSACCYTFPPNDAGNRVTRTPRQHWLYVTHGLSQWLSRQDMRRARVDGSKASGAGVEFAAATAAPAPWVPELLGRIMRLEYEARVASRRPFERGDRIPFYFESIDPGRERWAIGGEDGPDTTPADAMRAIIFWPYLSPDATFVTETGSFELRVATMITGEEWALAQETSSCHVLLMLHWAGIGQVCRPGRRSFTQQLGWEAEWERTSQTSFEDAKQALGAIARKQE